jgi:hypothetical protein
MSQAIGVLAAVLAVLLPGATSAIAHIPCEPRPGERVVIGRAEGNVTRTRTVKRNPEFTREAFRACLRSTNRRTLLGKTSYGSMEGDTLEDFVFAGRYLTCERLAGDRYHAPLEHIEQYDLRAGARTFGVLYSENPQLRTELGPNIVASRTGIIAWVLIDRDERTCPPCVRNEVLIVHDHAGLRVAASYPLPAPSTYERERVAEIQDLHISPAAVTWMHGTEARAEGMR